MRLFIAIKLDEQAVEAIQEYQKRHQQKGFKINKHLHITLRFLGETNEQKKHKIIDKLRNLEFEEYSTQIKGIGCFTNQHRKVIWAGIEDDGNTKALKKQVDQLIGEKTEDTTLHITLYRTIDSKAQVPQANCETGMKVRTVHLIQSTLSKNGPEYTDIAEFPLKLKKDI